MSDGLLHSLFLGLNKCLDVDNAIDIVFFFRTHRFDLSDLICLPDYTFSNGFLHQVNFGLANKFHVSVSQRNQHFLLLSHMLAEPPGARNAANLLGRGENQERI
jgi:hypothetical protein